MKSDRQFRPGNCILGKDRLSSDMRNDNSTGGIYTLLLTMVHKCPWPLIWPRKKVMATADAVGPDNGDISDSPYSRKIRRKLFLHQRKNLHFMQQLAYNKREMSKINPDSSNVSPPCLGMSGLGNLVKYQNQGENHG